MRQSSEALSDNGAERSRDGDARLIWACHEPTPGVGSTLGSYRVDGELGQGGMGVDYRAENLRLRRRVARSR